MKNDLHSLSLLTIKDAYNLLGVSRNTFMQLINNGRIRFVQVNKRIKIPLGELERFINDSLCQYTNITNEDLFYTDSNSTPVPQFNSEELFANILEKHNGKHLQEK
ncbi:helix-turn-helix domain-containing protein [Stygiobacter electus]|uniref:Helix-turn-helix domain-containing protein n=1 Tax=Stygiobacter electus TaxID=3032292 RepID=A0AAE3P1Y8_9BACT|nr:helix-turn-helix domain-containing protein [Stygiobacter electus]MDF1612292.1 helix-turn-helix domain-containing protein [Stygiobacter electus]